MEGKKDLGEDSPEFALPGLLAITAPLHYTGIVGSWKSRLRWLLLVSDASRSPIPCSAKAQTVIANATKMQTNINRQ